MPKVHLFKRNKPQEVIQLIKHETRTKMITSKLEKYHAYDISEALIQLDSDNRQKLYNYISPIKLATVFSYFDPERAADWLEDMDTATGVKLIELMEPDDAVDILQSLDDEVVIRYFVMIDDSKREQLKRLSRYGKDTAGSEMNTRYIALKPEMDVKEAMKHLIKEAANLEAIDTLFVTDDDERLVGVLDLKKLIVTKSPKKVEAIMNTNYTKQHVLDDIQEVIKSIQKYDIMAMPIVNDDDQIEGVITMYDAMDIIEEEAHEDYSRLAALPTEYDLRESAVIGAKRRLPWLLLLLVLNVFVAMVLNNYVETIDQIVALVLFQPIILGMAGNIGTQSLAVTVLSISKESLHHRVDIMKHLIKEFSVGLVNGLILGLLAFLMAYTFLSIVQVGTVEPRLVAMVVGLSVFIALSVSAFLGSAIPLILNAMKIDPAIASGPFITTINDITALVVYFSLAAFIILPLML